MSGGVGADFPLRAAAGIVLGILALGVAWSGGFLFLGFWLLAFSVVIFEWQSLPGGEGLALRVATGVLALIVAAPLALHNERVFAIAVIGGGAVLAGAVGRGRSGGVFWSTAGVLYAGLPFLAVIFLRGSPAFGLRAILWLFAVVWGCDVFAYFGGRLLQGPKLWPAVSPGKTWSGFFAGVIGGAAAGVLALGFAEPLRIFTLGLVAAAIAQGADLFESAIKRRFGVKDSGRIIPGHGGIMDRLDGFIGAAVFAAAYAATRAGGDWIASGLTSN